jgi:hypothetical protein
MNFKQYVMGLSALALIAGAAAAVSVAVAVENHGPDKLELDGGNRGKVPFPHRQHQENLGDCQICHFVFPQETGAIEKLKAEGKLKKKYVMNKLCTKCHRDKKKAGQQSGPTTCSKCHIKKRAD